MGFVAFVGRLFFATLFIFLACNMINDFGSDGGAALMILGSKYGMLKSHIRNILGFEMPDFDMKRALMAIVGLEGIGGVLFIFGRNLGAYLLLIYLAVVTPIVHDFYNYNMLRPEYAVEFIQFSKNLSLFGALVLFLDTKEKLTRKQKRQLTGKHKKDIKVKGN